jgi:hypothetical protein
MHGMKEEVIPRILAKESLNLSPAKEGSLKKREREEQGLKRKRGETSVEKLHVLREKKERMKFTSYWERFYQKKEIK